jgi:hypothetical protein
MKTATQNTTVATAPATPAKPAMFTFILCGLVAQSQSWFNAQALSGVDSSSVERLPLAHGVTQLVSKTNTPPAIIRAASTSAHVQAFTDKGAGSSKGKEDSGYLYTRVQDVFAPLGTLSDAQIVVCKVPHSILNQAYVPRTTLEASKVKPVLRNAMKFARAMGMAFTATHVVGAIAQAYTNDKTEKFSLLTDDLDLAHVTTIATFCPVPLADIIAAIDARENWNVEAAPVPTPTPTTADGASAPSA